MALNFDATLTAGIVGVAKRFGIEPAALLAVAEIESGGKALEQDGATPTLLFERHVFYRELNKRAKAKLAAAVSQGLAIPKWSKATQYRDERSSASRLALLARARAIDEECANRACSWGVGQTMGFLAEELGFANANDMVGQLVAGGVPTQIDCMVREIKNKRAIDKLNRHDWSGFALVYNGAGYKQNQYDVRLAAAYRRWAQKLAASAPPAAAEDEAEPEIPTRNAQAGSIVDTIKDSKIAQGAIGASTLVGGNAIADMNEKAGQLAELKGKVDSIGITDHLTAALQSPRVMIALCVVLLLGAIVWWRHRDHGAV